MPLQLFWELLIVWWDMLVPISPFIQIFWLKKSSSHAYKKENNVENKVITGFQIWEVLLGKNTYLQAHTHTQKC